MLDGRQIGMTRRVSWRVAVAELTRHGGPKQRLEWVSGSHVGEAFAVILGEVWGASRPRARPTRRDFVLNFQVNQIVGIDRTPPHQFKMHFHLFL